MSDLANLKSIISPYTTNTIAVAFSGGVDSSVLLAVLALMQTEFDFKVIAFIVDSSFSSRSELAEAKYFAENLHLEYEVLYYDQLSDKKLQNNPLERCYICKKQMLELMLQRAKELNITTIFDGTNGDDLTAHRPGLLALQELNINSPLAMAKLSKRQIRALATQLKLPVAQKPALSCLATRFDYGVKLNQENLIKVDQAEGVLRSIFGASTNLRLRYHDNFARIELDKKLFDSAINQKDAILKELKKFNFKHICLDLAGFCSGSMDNKT